MDHDRQALTTYDDIARRTDHALLDPALTEDQVRDGCLMAIEYGVSTVMVRPCDIDVALRTLRGTRVKLGSVVGFPHGSANTATKLYEARDLIRRGATELDVVITIAKLAARQWIYVETELLQLAQVAKQEGVVLKVILETPLLGEEQKIVACRIAKRAAVDFVATTTGFGGVFTAADLALLVRKCHPWLGVKAAGLTSLEDIVSAWRQGATRFGSKHTEQILKDWKRRLEQQAAAGAPVS